MIQLARRPRFSIVSAVYDVEAYLPDFIKSVEAQRIATGDLEVIAVDDGSTDGSLDVLRAWAESSRFQVTVLTKQNGGQGSARNLGLEHATGEWVTFTDPDDMLDRNFLRVADAFSARHPDVEIMAGRPIIFRDDIGRLDDSHPRRAQYRAGNRVVSLIDEPNVFSGSTTLSLLRLDRIQSLNLRFDERIRPNFEDGHFAVHYLLSLHPPRVGILRDARYLYRRRSAGTSTSQLSLAHPGRYSDVIEHGYLDVLDAAEARHGYVPAWLQHVLIYELSWYLSADDKIRSEIELAESLVPRFHDLLGRVVRRLEPQVVADHRVRRLRHIWADIFDHGYRDGDWHSPFVVRGKVDHEMGLQRVAYRFAGRVPEERFTLDGVPVEPAFAKTRSHQYFGRAVLHERILWLPLGEHLDARVGGAESVIRTSSERRRNRSRGRSLAALLDVLRQGQFDRLKRAIKRRTRKAARRLVATALRLATRIPPFQAAYRDAWVLMDRVNDADDNGERLFEHLRATRPDVNAWFVVARGSPDWRRLKTAGVERVVAWGSWRWRLLLTSCRWLISSHADKAIAEPDLIIRRARRRRWKFAFLQHGVIKDDLSLWLNQRDIDLFVVSTAAEYASVAGDGTGYTVTPKETRNTGLPRFDRLLAKGRSVPPEERDLVLVGPTWRTGLTLPIERSSQRRPVGDRYWTSDYHLNWMGVLNSPAIAEAAARRGWRVAFMPHPNFQPILGQLDLPAHVRALSFTGVDVQALYARAALLITDYSSVAFNVAYLDRPIVYFQFDRADVMRGGHMGRQGYFDYYRDGFGPVVLDVEAAVAAIVESIERGPVPAPIYQERIDLTFPVRDGGACARVVAAIEEMSRPWQPAGPAGGPVGRQTGSAQAP